MRSRRPGATRGLSPSFYDINEHSDSFQLDVTHQIKATDAGVGLRYETGRIDDALKTDQFPGTSSEQKLTDRQTTGYDLFDIHGFTETWIKKNLMLSSGFAYSDLDNHLSGSHIYGSDVRCRLRAHLPAWRRLHQLDRRLAFA